MSLESSDSSSLESGTVAHCLICLARVDLPAAVGDLVVCKFLHWYHVKCAVAASMQRCAVCGRALVLQGQVDDVAANESLQRTRKFWFRFFGSLCALLLVLALLLFVLRAVGIVKVD
jgi:hypothetical protein